MLICAECGEYLSPKADVCPICGRPVPRRAPLAVEPSYDDLSTGPVPHVAHAEETEPSYDDLSTGPVPHVAAAVEAAPVSPASGGFRPRFHFWVNWRFVLFILPVLWFFITATFTSCKEFVQFSLSKHYTVLQVTGTGNMTTEPFVISGKLFSVTASIRHSSGGTVRFHTVSLDEPEWSTDHGVPDDASEVMTSQTRYNGGEHRLDTKDGHAVHWRTPVVPHRYVVHVTAPPTTSWLLTVEQDQPVAPTPIP